VSDVVIGKVTQEDWKGFCQYMESLEKQYCTVKWMILRCDRQTAVSFILLAPSCTGPFINKITLMCFKIQLEYYDCPQLSIALKPIILNRVLY
jgi:hypothetical protein